MFRTVSNCHQQKLQILDQVSKDRYIPTKEKLKKQVSQWILFFQTIGSLINNIVIIKNESICNYINLVIFHFHWIKTSPGKLRFHLIIIKLITPVLAMEPSVRKVRLADKTGGLVWSRANMREQTKYCDVTLISKEGVQLSSHRLIFGVTSTFLQSEMQRNSRHEIVMKTVKTEVLSALLSCIYKGEAVISEKNLHLQVLPDNFSNKEEAAEEARKYKQA